MRLTAGVDVGGTKVLAALVDEGGAIRRRVLRSTDPEAGTASILAALEELIGSGDGVAAIGVGAAAYVQYPSGRIVFAPNLAYDDPDVAGAVRARFGVPCAVENDANAAVWAEHRFGAGRGHDHVVMVTVGTGIGGGIVAGGDLYRGGTGLAAEIGHMALVDGGPPCACGQRGCLEALASGTAIARMAREGIGAAQDSIVLELAGGDPGRITGAIVGEAARAGDDYAAEVLERAGRWLGMAFANLTNLLDPEVILVGGGGASSGPFLVEPARLELSRRIAGRRELPAIALATLGNDAGVIGAATLALAAVRA